MIFLLAATGNPPELKLNMEQALSAEVSRKVKAR